MKIETYKRTYDDSNEDHVPVISQQVEHANTKAAKTVADSTKASPGLLAANKELVEVLHVGHDAADMNGPRLKPEVVAAVGHGCKANVYRKVDGVIVEKRGDLRRIFTDAEGAGTEEEKDQRRADKAAEVDGLLT